MKRGSFSLGPEMREMRVHLDGIKIRTAGQKKANMHQETTNIHKNARLCKVIWVGSAQSQALPANSLLRTSRRRLKRWSNKMLGSGVPVHFHWGNVCTQSLHSIFIPCSTKQMPVWCPRHHLPARGATHHLLAASAARTRANHIAFHQGSSQYGPFDFWFYTDTDIRCQFLRRTPLKKALESGFVFWDTVGRCPTSPP